MDTLKQIASAIGGLLVVAAICFSFMYFKDRKNNTTSNPNNLDMYPISVKEADYQPNKNHLYPLYLEETTDTIVNEDHTVEILKVQVVKRWRAN